MGPAARKITLVLHDLPLGGTERIALRLASRWAEMGREVTLLCGSRRGALEAMVSDKIEVVECDPPIIRGPGSRARLGAALAAFVAERRPDMLFIPGNFHWPVLPAIARMPRWLRPGIVAQISTPLFRHGRQGLKQAVYNLRTRQRLRCADATISLSPASTAEADHILGRRITHWVRLPVLEDGDTAKPLSPIAGKTIVCAGRLVKEKGFDIALRAFALLEDKATQMILLGDGPERQALGALADRLGVAERVTFPGYVTDIRPWLTDARVFMLTSYYEGYAAVIVEALAAGRPVVATDCTPAATELLRTQGCAVAPIGDPAGLARALTQVMTTTPPDPRDLANAVAGFQLGPIAQSYLDHFDAVVARRARPEPRPVAAEPDIFAMLKRLSAPQVRVEA